MQNNLESDAALLMQLLQNPEGQALRRLLLQTGSVSQPSSSASTPAPSTAPPETSVQPAVNPITSQYNSVRAQFASAITPALASVTPPNSSSGLPSFLSPNTDNRNFNGLRTTYNLTLNTSSANDRRRQSAEVNLPRNRQSSSSNTHRVRGRAVPPPSLPAEPKGVEKCINPATGNLRVSILVHPPALITNRDYICFVHYRDTYRSLSDQNCLLYKQEYALDTLIFRLVSDTVTAMETSPMRYRFAESSRPWFPGQEHEHLPLGLLQLKNKGNVSKSDGQVHLAISHFHATATVADFTMPTNRNWYVGNSERNITEDYYLDVHLYVKEYGLVWYDAGGRKHTCLSGRMARMLYDDRGSNPPTEINLFDTPDGESSGGEDDENVPPLPSTNSVPNIPPRPPSTSAPLTQSRQDVMPPVWSTPFTGQRLQSAQQQFIMSGLKERVFAEACAHSAVPRLSATGSTPIECMDKLDGVIDRAIASGDCSRLLATERQFQILDSTHRVFSTGEGVEREVIYGLWARYLGNDSYTRFFVPKADDYATVRVCYPKDSVPPARLNVMFKFGIVTGLMVVYGMAPVPLDPCLLQYYAFNFELPAIHREFFARYHPETAALIDEWNRIGPLGDVRPFQSHFVSYHNHESTVYVDRDQGGHNCIGHEMLAKVVFGNEPPTHPEFLQFFNGLELATSNGFKLSEASQNLVMHGYIGGPEAFFNALYTGAVRSFLTLAPFLLFEQTDALTSDILTNVRNASGDPVATPQSLVEWFLQGTGLPCPRLFDSARGGFSTLLDVSEDAVSTEEFRPRHLVWATCGSPYICSTGGERVKIIFSSAYDDAYLQNYSTTRVDAPERITTLQRLGAEEGLLSFRSCFRLVRLPVEYLNKLATATYPVLDESGQPTETTSFLIAFEHWLLTQILNGIGGLTAL